MLIFFLGAVMRNKQLDETLPASITGVVNIDEGHRMSADREISQPTLSSNRLNHQTAYTKQNILWSLFRFSVWIVLFLLPALGLAAETNRPKLSVGGQQDNPPFEFLENGKPAGFNIDLIRAVAEVMGYDLDIRLGPWGEARQSLEQGNIDMLAGMYDTMERRKLVDFSIPHTMVSTGIVVRQDSPIRSFDDLRDKEIIVQERGVLHDILIKEGLASRIVAVADRVDGLRLLSSGKHDCFLMSSRLQAEYFIKTLKLNNLKVIKIDGHLQRYCFAVHKGNHELVHKLDEGLNILKVNGKYQEIYEKWFGVYEKRVWWQIVKYFVLALAIIAALFVASLFWSRSLQKRVEMRTAELRASEEALRKAHAELEQRVEERTVELKKANRHLRVSEQEKSLVLNSTMDLVAYFDTDMKILWANRRAASLANMSPEELRGRHCWEVWHQLNEPCAGCPVMSARETGQPQKAELPSPDGKGEWFVRAYPVKDDEGWLLGIAEFALDITERKRAEELLTQKTADLERSNEELEQFAFIISHDLKSPLASIGGFAQILQERHGNKLDDKARRALSHIIEGTHRMERLIYNLLAYARVTRGEQSFGPVDCGTVIDSALSNLRTEIEAHDAVITFDDLPVVHGDAMQFVQVFQNLIGNAIKYRSERPLRIHISTKRLDDSAVQSTIRIPQSEIKTGWLFSIADNGIGIDPADREQIFVIFKRLHHGDKYSGTGIGLAICKKIVERHGGRIWVDSEPGEGSTFYFTIPDSSVSLEAKGHELSAKS